jgi:hypothetical protein
VHALPRGTDAYDDGHTMVWLGSHQTRPGGGGGAYQLPLVHVVTVSHSWIGLEPNSQARPSGEHGSPFVGRLAGQGPPVPPLLLPLPPPEEEPELEPELEPDVDPELDPDPEPEEVEPLELEPEPELDPEPEP